MNRRHSKQKKEITLEELIIELIPFPPELTEWCNNHPEFVRALKNVHPKRFISPGMIQTSYPPTGDEVLGVYTYDYIDGEPKFKQDFIVNTGKLNNEFIIYTQNPAGSSKYVKSINEFFEKFGRYGYTKEDHHLTLDELPVDLQDRGRDSIRLACEVKGRLGKIPQYKINKIYKEVKELKKDEWIVVKKLNK